MRVVSGQAITYVIAGVGGLSKVITIQLIGKGSYRLELYLRTLERVAYTIVTLVLESLVTDSR